MLGSKSSKKELQKQLAALNETNESLMRENAQQKKLNRTIDHPLLAAFLMKRNIINRSHDKYFDKKIMTRNFDTKE